VQSTKTSANTTDTRATAGRAPLPAEHGTGGHFAHTSAGGFCSVCGTVWPCARGNADTPVPAMRSSHRS
jgi:hypothetical protein